MDPRKAATVEDEDMKQSFAEGFQEGRAAALGDVVPNYCVNYFFKRTQLRQKIYDDIALALAEVRAHLEHGVDAWVEIIVIDQKLAEEVAALDEERMPQLPTEGDRVSD